MTGLRSPLALLLTALSLAACRREAIAAGDLTRAVEVDGAARDYRLHVPRLIAADSALPVVFVFHGYGGSVEQTRMLTGFDALSEEYGFLAVYPQGTGDSADSLSWNAGACCGDAGRDGAQDVAFFRAMLEDLAAEFPVDRTRIYATGFSNGGMLVYRLACEAADALAAVAPVAGALMTAPCSPSEPVSLLHIHGLDDRLVPFDGARGAGSIGPEFWPDVRETAAAWAAWNGCAAAPLTDHVPPLTRVGYSGCRDGSVVELYLLEGTGHEWPRGEFSASGVIWSFFAAHPKAR